MDYPLSSRARRVLKRAEGEAFALGCAEADSAHILLALSADPDTAIGRTLATYGVDTDHLRRLIKGRRHGDSSAPPRHDYERALDRARLIAERHDRPRITVNELLAGVLSDGCVARSVVTEDGLPTEQIARVAAELSDGRDPTSPPPKRVKAPPRANGTERAQEARRTSAIRTLSAPSSPHLTDWVAAAGAIGFAVSFSLTTVSAISDIRAFQALATPALYATLGLSAACAASLVTVWRLRESAPAPRYLLGALLIGIAVGAVAVPNAWRVLTKSNESAPALVSGTSVDWAGQRIEGRNYAHERLVRAEMRGAVLIDVNFEGADLAEADFRDARLLKNVSLLGANLCGADLRGADLRGAVGLENVGDWAYAYYDKHTRLPGEKSFIEVAGPIEDTGRGLLYMCHPGDTRRLNG